MIDVVVPSAGSVDSLERTLRSVAASDRGVGVVQRMFVVDDRPERQRAAEVVAAAGATRIILGDAGPGAARNAGARAASADWLLLVDDDIDVDPPCLPHAAGHVRRASDDTVPIAVMGALRAPATAPSWLHAAYVRGTVTPATATAAEGTPVAGERLATPLLLVRRAAYLAVGGLPEYEGWGWEDAVFGMRLQALAHPDAAAIIHAPSLSGVHDFVPSWDEWLTRQERAGTMLARLRPALTPHEHERLLQAVRLGRGRDAAAKRLLGHIPRHLLRFARGAPLRRVAASAAFARGYREGARG